jgi:acetyltransferase-like isoleucine patch superfamily enzyme
MLLRRFLTPPIVVSLVYWLRYRAKISPRSEVDLTDNVKFGAHCVVSSFCKIKAASGSLILGDSVEISTHCFVHADTGGVTIGDHSMIGPLACIVGVTYNYDTLDRPVALQGKISRGIRIGKGVWIGAGAKVLDGADIGDNVIVTPNSVISNRIPPNTIVQGNPAQVIFTRR